MMIKKIFFSYSRTLDIPNEANELSKLEDFDLQAYGIDAAPEQLRAKRLVRIGAIQNKIVLPTTEPVYRQREAIFKRVEIMIRAAALCGVNIICLQEAWNMPFAFCTREKQPWMEFAENPNTGPTTKFLQNVILIKKKPFLFLCFKNIFLLIS